MQRLASNTSRRFPTLNISLLLGLMFFFVSCDINNDDDFTPSTGNSNSNGTLMGNADTRSNGTIVQLGSIQAVTEGTTSLKNVANRMEIPRLKGGTNNLFVVHTVPTYGVNYCIEWDKSLRAQRWTAYRWDKKNSVNNTSRSEEWAEDPLIPIDCRTTLDDHKSNGYDRGHIIGSQDRVCSYEANAQTFYMSNMHPQLNGFNGDGIWWNLENRLRSVYNKDSFRDTLYVVKGGTISEGKYTLAKNKIPVPDYFFMAILRKRNDISFNGGYAAIGFWMEHKANTDTDYSEYAVSIDELERKTGLDFFCNLPDKIETEVELTYSSTVWLNK